MTSPTSTKVIKEKDLETFLKSSYV
jgi:hypothetical protein